MTREEYKHMMELDFDDVNDEDIVDIGELYIEPSLPIERKRMAYVKKVKNPYLVRDGDIKIKVRFANNGISMEDAFKAMLLSV